jgi:hypothetical protein
MTFYIYEDVLYWKIEPSSPQPSPPAQNAGEEGDASIKVKIHKDVCAEALLGRNSK